jgi:stage II sporulation protein D
MKNMYLIIIFVITTVFLLVPLLATKNEKINIVSKNEGTSFSGDGLDASSRIESNENNASENAKVKFEELKEVRIYLGSEEKIVTLNIEEYLIGVVAAEMSAANNIEALKAQALAAYTYAFRKQLQNNQTTNEYDLTDDSKSDQRYINQDARKNKWGEKFEENESKIKQAITEVKNKLIVYNNEPILAVYHRISSGKTETAKNVWGSDYPYLQSENSVGDLLCPDFYSEVSVTAEDFSKKLTDLGATGTGEFSKFIGKSNKSSAGTVLTIELCGKSFSGVQIREAFNLKSAAFDLAFKDNNFIFSVSGDGHGVGMSQYGANYMAQQGSDYKEIILAYYRGSEIIDIKA